MRFIPTKEVLDVKYELYYVAIKALERSKAPFLIGGAFALEHYTGVTRWTKDLDIFILPEDCERVLEALSEVKCQVELTFPHWLGKAFCGEGHIDIIFNSGNGVCRVDNTWFENAPQVEILNMIVKLIPPEELIWSKSFIMERERYDGADIAHILRACGKNLDWQRLLNRFGSHWRLLLSHLILFGFIYPTERSQIPDWVMKGLIGRLQNDMESSPATDRVCQGTLLSRIQYIVDIECWGYEDARLIPRGNMTSEEIAHWTEAAEEEE